MHIVIERLFLLLLWVLSVIGTLFALIKMLLSVFAKHPRTIIYGIAADQFANVSIGGQPDETISSRAYRGALEGKFWWSVLRTVLDWVETDHCKQAYESEINRSQLPKDFQGK
ncbi:hypothetical protein LJC19_04670 [Oxalobacter sp. OttesenSCG-928-P03]|nr:hypothetical protein [Oxalobacter sp. OttesenSCG-928-P03]